MARTFTRRQSVVWLFGSLACAAVAVFFIRIGELRVMAWIWLVFFGAGALVFAFLAVTGRKGIARLQPEGMRIVLEPEGFAVLTRRGRRFPVRWAGVRRVRAWKRDLWSTDEILVAFESDEAAEARLISEEWPGFQDLFGPMEKQLGISPGWYLEIMTPAFEPKHRVLFERADAGETQPPTG